MKGILRRNPGREVTKDARFGEAHRHLEAEFELEKFEDQSEEAITELINAKRNGKIVGPKPRPRGENVVDLMDALKKVWRPRPPC